MQKQHKRVLSKLQTPKQVVFKPIVSISFYRLPLPPFTLFR
ncbi:hypothetical protein HMPREF1870_02319 [Bacteroidales bacterium KA00344]|nr:hypothetical protein HMPREF1870_02319 [Bacteroidales bacterium KA00344]